MFKVYHANEPNFGIGRHIPFTDENFTLVAEVRKGLSYVFFLTNHTDEWWWNNADVTCIKQSRSTSVGDVVVNSEGKKFRCEPFGWSEIKELVYG